MNPAHTGAVAIREAFDAYQAAFREITCRAKTRFELRDWLGIHRDGNERLDLYSTAIDQLLDLLRKLLGGRMRDHALWAQIKTRTSDLFSGREDSDLGETFFSSVSRRVFETVGVDPAIEFTGLDLFFESIEDDEEVATGRRRFVAPSRSPLYRTYSGGGSTRELIEWIITDHSFSVAYEDLERDARCVADEIDTHLASIWREPEIVAIEILRPIFYRNKAAYIIGRIRGCAHSVPVVMPLLNRETGIHVDSVLLTEEEISIVFSFTRSYFHVDVSRPREAIEFLNSIVPLKKLSELYISIGHHKHGKTLLYRELSRHLARTKDQFEVARGEKGMVMLVFTMPSYDLVFKIIRDEFARPKETTREKVMKKYQLVFKHDRAGRLIDAQQYEHLRFDRALFREELLEELLAKARQSVAIDGEHVAINHLYVERRVTPLNLHVREQPLERAKEAVVDYGEAIKDLARTNIFPGDILLKNFGVTRHSRVVCYDYDELCLLTDLQFRHLPAPRDDEEEFGAEAWFYVDENDVFPEEFMTFLGLSGELREAFEAAHADLLSPEFYRALQVKHRAGEVTEIYPYRRGRRLRNNRFYDGRGPDQEK